MTGRRWAILLTGEAVLATVAAATFWHQDWRYRLPTPVPPGYVAPTTSGPTVRAALGEPDGRPVWLHFVNPDCPCSRFNLDHARALVQRFAGRVRCVVVTTGPGELNLLAERLVDPGGRLATELGVYSSPQAVVLAGDYRLVYRGNYNRSRYCADPRSEFVRIALDHLLAGTPPPDWPAAATTAYGCPLPTLDDTSP